MKFGVISLFPEFVESIKDFGVVGRGFKREILQLNSYNPRDYTLDKNGRIDDSPYGGGAGMVMQLQPLRDAILAAKADMPKAKVYYMSPQGKRLDQKMVEQLALEEEIIFLSGRYEGIDERVFEYIDDEISLGDYVLSGGDLAAMVVIDAVSRKIKGVLGSEESSEADSFSDGILDYPHYTRPEIFDGKEVPSVLLSGNHAKIKLWRRSQALAKTMQKRPDLLELKELSKSDKKLLEDIKAEQGNRS